MGRVSDAKERLVTAAIELIWPNSYGGVSVDDICARAGVKKGSFYHFFETKDHLVIEALEANWQTRRPTLDRVFSATVAPLDRFRDYFHHVFLRQQELKKRHGRVLGCLHASIGSECIAQNPAIARKVQEIFGHYTRYYETSIRDAVAEGTLQVRRPHDKARSLFALMEGVLCQARLENDLRPVRRLGNVGFALLGAPSPEGHAAHPH